MRRFFADRIRLDDHGRAIAPHRLFVDAGVARAQRLEPIPPPRRTPPVLTLDEVLGPDAVREIEASGRLVFHAVGDTGGVKHPGHQMNVAAAMAADLSGRSFAQGRPAFFFHLGDLVYYFGEERCYYDQFYDAYRDYDAPIVAIPGNHDGAVYAGTEAAYSLEPFCRHFCQPVPVHTAAAGGVARDAMTQPGVYFTLDAPFVRIIGLYSNVGEGSAEGVISGGILGSEQVDFLGGQLARAAADRAQGSRIALVIAVHHPPFTASVRHVPSPGLLHDLDSACEIARVWPDLVLSGHAHVYERYTRILRRDGREIPFVVAGTGGYFNLSGFKTGGVHRTPAPGTVATDRQGNQVRLESYLDSTFGFLRVDVSEIGVTCCFMAVDEGTRTARVADMAVVTFDTRELVSGNRVDMGLAKNRCR